MSKTDRGIKTQWSMQYKHIKSNWYLSGRPFQATLAFFSGGILEPLELHPFFKDPHSYFRTNIEGKHHEFQNELI